MHGSLRCSLVVGVRLCVYVGYFRSSSRLIGFAIDDVSEI